MKLKIIIPSIFGCVQETTMTYLEQMVGGDQIDKIHFDGLSDLASYSKFLAAHNVTADIHLLSDKPMADLDLIISSKYSFSTRAAIHYETGANINVFSEKCKDNKIIPGLAIKLATPIDNILQDCKNFSYIHLIAIDEPAGIPLFQNSVLEKVSKIRATFPRLLISLDCGVKEEHIVTAMQKGASNLIMGSAIFKNKNPLKSLLIYNGTANMALDKIEVT